MPTFCFCAVAFSIVVASLAIYTSFLNALEFLAVDVPRRSPRLHLDLIRSPRSTRSSAELKDSLLPF